MVIHKGIEEVSHVVLNSFTSLLFSLLLCRHVDNLYEISICQKFFDFMDKLNMFGYSVILNSDVYDTVYIR